MATLDNLVGLITARLGGRPGLENFIVTEADFQREFVLEAEVQFRPKFLLNDPDTITTVDAQDYVAIPADFIAEYEEGFLSTTADDGLSTPLVKGEYAFQEATNKGSGRPDTYVMRNGKIFLYPVPDAIYTLNINYYGKTDSLKEVGTNVWLNEGFNWLLNTTGAVVATYIQNVEMARIFAGLATQARHLAEAEAIEFVALNAELGRNRTL